MRVDQPRVGRVATKRQDLGEIRTYDATMRRRFEVSHLEPVFAAFGANAVMGLELSVLYQCCSGHQFEQACRGGIGSPNEALVVGDSCGLFGQSEDSSIRYRQHHDGAMPRASGSE